MFEAVAVPLHKRTVWLFGGGPSLDLIDLKAVDRRTSILVTTNAAIQLLKPDYQICNDAHAIPHWARVKWARECVWIDRGDRGLHLAREKVPHIDGNTLYKRSYTGTGAEAMNFAYYLWYTHPHIEKIIYTGFDFSEVELPGVRAKESWVNAGTKARARIVRSRDACRYVYPHCLKVMPYQETVRLPKGWWLKPHHVRHTWNACYHKQLIGIARACHGDKRLHSVLECRSFIDFSKLDFRRKDAGYAGALGDICRGGSVQSLFHPATKEEPHKVEGADST